MLVAAINNGTPSPARTTVLTFQAGDGTDDPAMNFTGAQAVVNAALNGPRYTPDPTFTRPAGIQVRSGPASGLTGSVRSTFGTASITVVDGSCGPRPPVRVQSVRGTGQLQVTISTTPFPGGANPLAGLGFGALQNAILMLNGQADTSNQPIPLPATRRRR